jgi:hypothetical protein
MWDWMIRAKRVSNLLPVLENVLAGFGKHPSRKTPGPPSTENRPAAEELMFALDVSLLADGLDLWASMLAFIRHRDPGDHWEVAPVEGYEIRAVLSRGRSDQGVREAGAVAPSVLSPVEPAEPGRFLRDRQDDKRQEKLFQGFLFFIVSDSGKQFGYRDDRYVEVRRQTLQVLYGFAPTAEVFDQDVSVYEQPPGHTLPLNDSIATLVKLPTQRPEVG